MEKEYAEHMRGLIESIPKGKIFYADTLIENELNGFEDLTIFDRRAIIHQVLIELQTKGKIRGIYNILQTESFKIEKLGYEKL